MSSLNENFRPQDQNKKKKTFLKDTNSPKTIKFKIAVKMKGCLKG